MTQHPADRPDPFENSPPMRARVPDHVAAGQISTGVIVVTGATEFILDFVRNLPRPNIIVARIVLPHPVMPQFIEALSTNIQLYKQRFHDLNQLPPSQSIQTFADSNPSAFPSQSRGHKEVSEGETQSGEQTAASPERHETAIGGSFDVLPGAANPEEVHGNSSAGESIPQNPQPHTPSSVTRHPSPQEVYDELKLKDELLSGAYANAVMIGHGPHEFSFDFITNFYPQSAVSSRVFMAAGHVVRLIDSLRAAWDQLRSRMN